MPQISVIVPVYKVEQFLARCVDSILSQSFTDFELILVDDGSPDRCGAICDDYARLDNRIHVIHQPNGGLSAARNTGLDWLYEGSSQSQWIAFVDSDDWIHPDYLRCLHTAATENNCRIAVCGFFRTSGEPFPEAFEAKSLCLSSEDYYCGEWKFQSSTAVAWNKLYHRSLLETLRYPQGKLHEDEFTTYQAVYAAEKVAVWDLPLYAYYQNPQGIMLSKWNPRRLHIVEAFEQQIAFAQSHGRERLLCKIAEQYVYSTYDHLNRAAVIYHKELRNKLRQALKLGRECGAFPKNHENMWAYEAAYPCKPYWWLRAKIQQMQK